MVKKIEQENSYNIPKSMKAWVLGGPSDEVVEVTLMLDEILSIDSIEQLIKSTFDIDLYVPLLIEQKVGVNWLEMH